MNERDICNAMYGAIRSLVVNREYFYEGGSYYYSHFTDKGKEVATEIVAMYAPKILEAIHTDLEENSKKLVFQALKDTKN